ncbi:hypothetical protein M426DRAFT_321157 [Hypoxylon sp. CI-4A]|nr:hypothetical protein M426DRAFT_321157 [Hypoxylon sp. CI-4A]
MDSNEKQEPTLPPQEQMRLRRLEKLGGGSSSSSSISRTGDASVKPDTQATPSSTPIVPATNPPNTNTQKEESSKPTPSSSRQNSTTDQTCKLGARSLKKALAGNNTTGESAPPSKKMQVAKEETLENWSNKVLSDIFRVTLDETRTADPRGNKLTYLPELKSELEESGEPIKLTSTSIDGAILESARYLPTSKALLDYLLPCWKRVVRTLKHLRNPPIEKRVILDEAKRLCMSNCIFALTMPEYFGRDPNPNHDSLVPYLLRNSENDDGICLDFFGEAVSRIPEDETVAGIFTDAMVSMSKKLATMTMNDDYRPYLNTLVTYSKFLPLLRALTEHPYFRVNPTSDMSKEQIALASETQTILGPFFRISPLQTEVTGTYFASPRSLNPSQIKSSQNALQMTLKAHQSDLAGIVNAFIRSGESARSRILDWFAFIVNSNHKRRALQVKSNEVASDGFMVNITAILDKLCEPFMDASFGKVERIDTDYLRRHPRVDMSDETKLNADQATASNFYSTKVPGSSNFISEVFFLTLAAHHYGLGATNSKLKDLDREIKYVEGLIKKIEIELPKLESDPIRLAVATQQHKRAVTSVEKFIALKYTIEGVILDESVQTLSLLFMRYVSVWLLRVASGTEYIPGKTIKLPLSSEKPDAFSCLPEYALQDVVENFKFIFRFLPQISMSAVGDEIITLCITFLRSSEYIKNPYLKSSLVTLLFSGTWPVYHLSKGVLGETLVGSSFANEHLLHALMKFYIECEHSGVSSAFYDKFNIRYEIFQVIKCIWPNTVYKEQLSRESKVNRQFFVQFVNLLLNDATYLLDEALTKLIAIHDYQTKLRDDRSLSQEDREKITGDLEQAEQQCQSWMQLVNDTMGMMKLFTAALRDAFTMPEIVTRLAGMLNYNLETLVGPKRSSLRVENAQKYRFDPKTLLSDFIDIYINLGPKPSFVDAVAADGRSYKPSNFEKAADLLKTKFNRGDEVYKAWISLMQKFAEAKGRMDQAELDLGEIPSEFEDPLMGDLMVDPVILPSKNVVDRSTIVQQLLSNPLDPFTRNPMTIEDVVPDNELRLRIEEWKAERIAAAKATTSGETPGDAMDTTAG